MPKSGGGRLGAFATAKDFFQVIRELSFDDVKEDAERAPGLLVLAPDDLTANRIGMLLIGPQAESRPATASLFAHLPDLERFDAVVVFDPTNTGRTNELRKRVRSAGLDCTVVLFVGDEPNSESEAARVRATITSRLTQRAPAFGRVYPAFREAAVKAVLDDTAQVNAQFAFVANIPALIPVVGSFFAAGADAIILTKNQIMMLYKIAAIHGKPLDNRRAFLHEMLSVVGASMLWRTIARNLTSFLPFAAGTIPKVIVAFAGTVVVGYIADYYYRFGTRPNSETILSYYKKAVDAAKRIRLPGSGNSATAPSSVLTAGVDGPAEEDRRAS